MSREEGEETATTPTLLQRDSPDFVSLEEDTSERGERREGRLERENFRLKEQVLYLKFYKIMSFEYILDAKIGEAQFKEQILSDTHKLYSFCKRIS